MNAGMRVTRKETSELFSASIIACFSVKKLLDAGENWFCQITSYFAEIAYYLRERFLRKGKALHIFATIARIATMSS